MKVYVKNKKKGYTLIEMSVVMVLIVLIASTLTSMLGQQVQFLNWWNTQKFIAEDAPLVNNMVVRLFSQADGFQVYDNTGAGTTANGDTLLLGFTNSDDGGKSFGRIQFDGVDKLEYSNMEDLGAGLVPVAGSTWTMASGVSSATFSVAGGIMQLTLVGPYGGTITYAATPSL
jgi:prepilin-type N-terminal cleavage/methylation domain-containing protein